MSLRVHTFTLQFKLQPAFRSLTRFASSKPWKVTGLNHVALVTPNIEKAGQFYRDTFGVEVDKPFLISPTDDASPVAKFLAKNKRGGLHHVCIEVDDLEAAIEGFKAKGMKFLTPEPKIGACGVPIIFFDPRNSEGALIELEQSHSDKKE